MIRVDVRQASGSVQSVSLRPGRTQIGRGPNSQIRLSDPTLVGNIQVEVADGTVQVRHDLPHQIYLNRQPFPPNEARTWYHGHELQPTADTILVLMLEHDAQTTAAKANTVQWVAACVMLVLGLGMFVMPAGSETTTPGNRPAIHVSVADLHSALTGMAASHSSNMVIRNLPVMLSEARGHEIRRRRMEALTVYLQMRDAIEQLMSNGSAASLSETDRATLTSARTLINDRLIRYTSAPRS